MIHHSDRGSQYCSREYQRLLRQFGMRVSMSRKGNGYNNATMGSFWGVNFQHIGATSFSA